MAAPRRVGAETSETRDRLLDGVERLMLDKGYAGVTYRAVARQAGVAPALVQYYFPTLDDVFVAAIRRRSGQNLARLTEALRARPEQPLRVLWAYSRDEAMAALTSEFLAVGNHRPSIRAVIAEVTEEVRHRQLDVLAEIQGEGVGIGPLSPEAVLFLLTGVPKLLRLEEGVGVTTSHDHVVAAFERYLDEVEPDEG